MTKEEILNKCTKDVNYNDSPVVHLFNSQLLFAMQAYADQQSAEKDTQLKDLHQQLSSLKASMDILKELVECKNLNADSQSYMKTDHYYAYLRRFETAWEQARKVIAGESIIPKGEQKENENYVPYQLCPKCNGIGMVTPRYDSTSCFEQCDVCNGTKIIPMHPIPPQ